MQLASSNASFHEGGFTGALLRPIKLAFALTLVLLGILVAAWIVDWVFVSKVWPDGLEHLRRVLSADLANAVNLAESQGGNPDAIVAAANGLYGLVFGVTGIHEMAMRFAEGSALSIPDTIMRNTYMANTDAIEVAMIGTQLLGVRLATLVLLVPIVALIYFVAAADGITQRAIRRTGGGRESASLYHRAKHLQVALIAVSLLISLLSPIPIDIRSVGAPLTGSLGILARLQWKFYKKHV